MKSADALGQRAGWIHAQFLQLLGLTLLASLLLPEAAGTGLATWSAGGSDDNWSNPDNWTRGEAPTYDDIVGFRQSDSGNTNIVDADFVIAALAYTGGGTHTTDFAGVGRLQIDGPLYVGYGEADPVGTR